MLSGTEETHPHEYGKGFETLIADDSEGEELYAELWLDDEMWGEINQEDGKLTLELYPKLDGEPWRFPAEAVEKLLKAARCDLLGLDMPKDEPEVA